MAFDVSPVELGIVPDIGATSAGPSASGIKFNAQESRSIKSRKSTKPLLKFLCDICNYVLQDICGQQDMEFTFEGLRDEQDEQAIVSQGVELIQNGIYSIDEVRDLLDKPPWGLEETTEPVVFTAQGPIPLSMAKELIANLQGGGTQGAQGTNGGQRTTSSRTRNSQPTVRRGGQTKPNGSHPAPVAPHRESVTPAHSAAAGAIQSPGPRTGGTPSRSSVAGSRKKAVDSELAALARHLRKGRQISTWDARHIPARALGMIAEDLAKGVLIDTALERAGDICLKTDGDATFGATGPFSGDVSGDESITQAGPVTLHKAAVHWPGWERDLGLVGAYKNLIGQAFHDAEAKGSDLRKKAATGGMFVSNSTLRDLISDEVRQVFSGVLTPLWTEAWHLGYAAAKSLATGQPADFSAKGEASEALTGFLASEGEHWLQQVARTGLGNNSVRSETIAWSEVGRAVNTAAIQCYRDHGVTHKHLLLSPNACDLCKDAAEDGDIPLDAPFSAGGVTGQVHIRCRCAPGPAGVEAEPPLADLGKVRRTSEDESRLCWLLLRARDEDGKWRFLLQQRPDGSWGMPGGKPHVGEDSWAAALRETTEEIGGFPPAADRRHLPPRRGRREDPGLPVAVRRAVLPPDARRGDPGGDAGCCVVPAQGDRRPRPGPEVPGRLGARHHPAGARHQGPAAGGERERGNPDPHPGVTVPPGGRFALALPEALRRRGMAGQRPRERRGRHGRRASPRTGTTTWPNPSRTTRSNRAAATTGKCRPRGASRTLPLPRSRTRAAYDEMWPEPRNTLQPPATSIGARTGVPPSGAIQGRRRAPGNRLRTRAGTEAVRAAQVEPEAFDPGDTVEEWSDGGAPTSSMTCPGKRARSTSPTPTPSNGATCTRSWSPTSRTPPSNGSSTPPGSAR